MKYVMESITAIKELILYEVKDYFQKKQLKEKKLMLVISIDIILF